MAEPESTLVPGIERSDEFTVEGRLITSVGGTIGASVLSTPGMIGMMEAAATALALEHMPEGQATWPKLTMRRSWAPTPIVRSPS
jgi:predicted thioesterase